METVIHIQQHAFRVVAPVQDSLLVGVRQWSDQSSHGDGDLTKSFIAGATLSGVVLTLVTNDHLGSPSTRR